MDCCEDKACAIEALRERQSATLKIVLAINAVMFVVELASGLMSRSTALMSDALDNLGDALTYGLSLYAVSRGPQAKARVALFKGGLILVAGLFVLGQVGYRLAVPAQPIFETMGVIALVALAANGLCLALLWKHRREDVNMSSVWECSRNDIRLKPLGYSCGSGRVADGLKVARSRRWRVARAALPAFRDAGIAGRLVGARCTGSARGTAAVLTGLAASLALVTRGSTRAAALVFMDDKRPSLSARPYLMRGSRRLCGRI